MNSKCVYRTVRKFFEYVWIILVLIETNSLFKYSVGNNSSDIHDMILNVARILLIAMIVSLLLENTKLLSTIKAYLPVLISVVVLVFAYKGLNVNGETQNIDYFARFCTFLPLACLYFFLLRKNGEHIALWYKFSNVVFYFAVLNLLIYVCVVVNSDVLTANVIQTTWSDPVRSLCNYYNFCVVGNGLGRYFFGIFLPRNLGIYPEPLMYVIPLLVSLYTELFFSDEDKIRIYRCVVYSAVLISSQSTLGIILLIFSWGLKGMDHYKGKIKIRTLLVLCVVAFGGCVGLFAFKYIRNPESFSAHFQDYIYAVKAFLTKPLLGCGYENEEYIKSFMSENRRSTNPGLSNSVAVVLAEGGILLGFICMIPFLVGVVQFFNKRSKENKKIAFWTIGCFSLYCVTIFHFHLTLLVMMAFGYSLWEVQKKERGWKLCLLPEDAICNENDYVARKIFSKKQWIISAIGFGSFIILLMIAKPIWSALYGIMQANQLLIGTHIWYWLCLVTVFLFVLVYLRMPEIQKKYKAYLLVYTLLFALVKSWVYGWIHTLLVWKDTHSDLTEAELLVGIYFLGVIVIHIAYTCWNRLTKKTAVLSVFVILIGIGMAGSIVFCKLEQHEYVVRSEREALDKMMGVNAGKLYVDDLPVFYHHFYPRIKYATGSGESYASKKDVTVLMPYQTNNQELFNAGFEITQISEKHVLYSNDEKMIAALKKEGYTFYHYYPYPVLVDMEEEAKLNDLKMTKDGGCIVEGESASLLHGPYCWLDAGQYEVVYKLHIKNLDQNTTVCRAQINAAYGQEFITSQEINSDMVDADGNITVSINFNVQQNSSVIEFLLFGYGENQVEIKEIGYWRKYEYVSVNQYNGKHLVELTRYYSANNDEPYAADNGCYAVGKKYDNRNRVIERDYYDEKLQLTNTMSGYSIVKYQYNTDTGTTTVFYYNKDGEPFVFESGYAAEKITYFEDGGEKIYLDASGEEITLSNGYSKEKWTINESGKEVERAFYSITGELVNNIWGYASVLREYNAQGLIMKKSYVNVQGDAVDSTEGYQSMVWEYDASGVLNRTSTYDVNGKMVWEQVQNDVS